MGGEEGAEVSNNLPLSNSRYVTTRDDESMARSSDDVFMAEEESESFKQQVSLQSGAQYVHPLAPKGPIGGHRNLQPNLTIKAGQVYPQAGLPGVWANHQQEPKLPVNPSPATDLGHFLSRGLPRSSSLPVAVKRKNSLVDVMRDQKEKEKLFHSHFETEKVLGSRCPPGFPSADRRTSTVEVNVAGEEQQ